MGKPLSDNHIAAKLLSSIVILCVCHSNGVKMRQKGSAIFVICYSFLYIFPLLLSARAYISE